LPETLVPGHAEAVEIHHCRTTEANPELPDQPVGRETGALGAHPESGGGLVVLSS
jgi:hypothetical protein